DREMAAALQYGASAFELGLPHASAVRGARCQVQRSSGNGPDRCGMWGLRAPARCSTVPPGTSKGRSQGGRLKLKMVRRNRAGQKTTAIAELRAEQHKLRFADRV